MIILYILLAAFAAAVVVTAIELAVKLSEKSAQELPNGEENEYYAADFSGRRFEDLYLYLSGKSDVTFTEDEAFKMLLIQSEYMAHRFDCSDFRAQLLFKIYKDCREKLSERSINLIKDTFLNFKYFMDEPGDDSMCYWSENHQILFAVSEYLAGQEWQADIFVNSGMNGAEHMKKAENRIEAWISQRFNYGFSEYLSNNYLAEDISPMANFIAYCNDRSLVEKMRTVMDILWLDVALNSVNNRFVAVSSRMYGNNKAGNFYGNSIQTAMNVLWGNELAESVLEDSVLSGKEKRYIRNSVEKRPNSIVICFTDIVGKGLYVLPEAIKDIALSRESFAVKMGCGLSPDDLAAEKLVGQEPYQIMAQMGAEAFTNPQVIKNTLRYIKQNNMHTNSFVSYFKFLDLSVFKLFDFEKIAGRHNILPHGIATGRGNVYTWRTDKYSMSTNICGDVGMCSTQGHIWTANISETLCLFSTQPSGTGENRFGASPGYWIGNGRRPMSVQHENVNITIYRLPEKKRLGEAGIARMTHIYMPQDFYDEFELSGNMAFARKNGVFAAIVSDGEMKFKPYNKDAIAGLNRNLKGVTLDKEYIPQKEFDLCRFGGEYNIYITELSDCKRETFADFKNRIKSNPVKFGKGTAEYSTYFGEISASYQGDFLVNGEPAQKEFARYDCEFCKAERKAQKIFVDSGEHRLMLCLEK